MSRAVAGTAAAAAMNPAAVRVRKSFKLSLLFVRDDFVRVFFEAKRRADAGVPAAHVLAASRSPQREVGHAWRSGEASVGKPMQTQFKALCRQFVGENIDACHVTARRARLVIRPSVTGSSPATKTMGIVVVTALATNALMIGPAIAATCRRTNSVASADSRSI